MTRNFSRLAIAAVVPIMAAICATGSAQAQPAARPQPIKLEKLPYSGSVLVARALRSGAYHLAAGGVHGAAKIFPGLNCTPAPCALHNKQASSGGTQPVDETPISADSINKSDLITGGNDYNCGSTLAGFWTSSNGGKAWSGSCIGLAAGHTSGAGDPAVGYDLNGNVFRGSLQYNSGGSLDAVISKSTDNGTTWSTPVVDTSVSGFSTDKDWLQIDTNPSSPNKNDLYVCTTQFASNNNSTIYVSHSTDGGTTWTSVAASPQAVYPNVNQFCDLNTGPTGTVYVTYMNCTANGNASDCGGTNATLFVQSSADGGTTWSKQHMIGTVALAPDTCGGFYGCLPNTSERVSEIPVIGVDNSGGTRSGQLYVVEYNWTGTYMQVQVTSSTDNGKTWSPPVAVAPNTDTHDQFFPWLNVNATGLVGVTWLDRRNDPANVNYQTFGTWSNDGGATFATNITVASVASDPFDDGFNSGFMGDYTGNSWFGKKLFAAWSDTRSETDTQDEIGGLKK